MLDQDNNALSDSPQEQACLLPPTDLDSSVFNHHELGEHRDDDSLSSILFNWEDLDMNQWTDELLPESLLNFDQYDFCDLYCGFVNEGPGPFGSSTV